MPRDGTKNLKPVQTKEEARIRGRNGGIRSGEVRRKKRNMKNAINLVLDMPILYPQVNDTLVTMGFNEEDLTNQVAIVVSMVKQALDGNVSAAAFLRDTSGRNSARNEDYALRKRAEARAEDEFEYRKQKEAGIEYEIEDLDEIEGRVYGGGEREQVRQAEGELAEPAETEDDPV